MISTSIKLDGEQEFKRQLGDVNSNLRTLKSELSLTAEEFKGQANSMEALEAKSRILNGQVEQQTEKVKALEKALEQAGEAFKDQPRKIDEYQRSLNSAKTELTRLQRELDDTDRYLDEARRSTDKAAFSIDEFGKAVNKTADSKGGGGLKAFIGGLGALKTAIVGGALVGGMMELKDAILGIVEGTAEYRKIMGTLETSSQNAGYTALETSEAYNKLYSVLGDPQTAATTVANLQAIGLEQDNLMTVVNSAIGAWAKYGDSIPIDGLAEAINETIQAGQVTGVFADVLNWAGVSEDAFNEKLKNAGTIGQRVNLVMQELADQGLAEAAKGWRENNADIVAMNEAQNEWEQATGRLGEVLTPAATALISFGADAVEFVTDLIIEASDAIKDFIDWFEKMSGKVDEVDEWSGAPTWGTGDIRSSTAAEIAGANTRTTPAASAQDVYNAAAASANAVTRSAGERSREYIGTTVLEVDGREFARTTQRYFREEDRSNPEVVSDSI